MTGLFSGIHPIEAESYRILAERFDLSGFGPLVGALVARVIHATADPEYATTMVATEEDVAAGVDALRSGAPVVTDVQMVRHGIPSVDAVCYLGSSPSGEGDKDDHADGDGGGLTRSAAGMRGAAADHPRGAVVVVGCAPTALEEVVRLHRAGAFEPALVVGVPVGFVGAAASKESLRASGLPAVSNVGDKGGSPVAAAVVNALQRLALDPGAGR